MIMTPIFLKFLYKIKKKGYVQTNLWKPASLITNPKKNTTKNKTKNTTSILNTKIQSKIVANKIQKLIKKSYIITK